MDQTTPNKKKINVNTLLNIILLIGLVTLYILYFSNKKSNQAPQEKATISNLPSSSIPRIAFVNSDSLLNNFDMYKEMQEKIQIKQKELEGQAQWQKNQFEKEVKAFYQKIQNNGFLTEESAKKEQMKLAEKEQQIMQMTQKLGTDMANFELEWHSKVLDSITTYLKKYNKTYNYDYILGFAKGGGILLANDSLDITYQVLNQLNKNYTKSNKEEKTNTEKAQE